MKIKSQSYPDKIRRIASDLKRMRISPEVDSTADKLGVIANDLEQKLKEASARKS